MFSNKKEEREFIFKEGDDSDSLYIIISGEVQIYRKGQMIENRERAGINLPRCHTSPHLLIYLHTLTQIESGLNGILEEEGNNTKEAFTKMYGNLAITLGPGKAFPVK